LVSNTLPAVECRLRDGQLSRVLADLRSQLSDWKSQAEVTAEQQKSATQVAQQSQFARDALQRSFAEAQARYAELQAEQKAVRMELAASNVRLEQLSHDLQAARAGTEQKDKLLAELQAKLQDATLRTEEQEAIVARLGRQAATSRAGGPCFRQFTFRSGEPGKLRLPMAS
jgi:chromosome segregation ATPase